MAATLVSAAGALLFNKRGGERDKNTPSDEVQTPDASPTATAARGRPRSGAAGRKTSSSLPSTDATDPRVAAGVVAQTSKKKRTGPKPRRQARPQAETPQDTEALPGAYPDGSPLGDTVGRTSVEGESGDRAG